mmetsp:Transcript_6562/g.11726  ORF Transcript_6562/g.11726 Transcript_6562/m.11726 type:complete len:292 (-) Transcript_6562:1253-2128(-)
MSQQFRVSDGMSPSAASSYRAFEKLTEEVQTRLVENTLRYLVAKHSNYLPVKREELQREVIRVLAPGSRVTDEVIRKARKLAGSTLRCDIVELKLTRRNNGTLSSLATQSATPNPSMILSAGAQHYSQMISTQQHTQDTQSSADSNNRVYLLVSQLSWNAREILLSDKDRARLGLVAYIIAVLSLARGSPEITEAVLYQVLKKQGVLRNHTHPLLGKTEVVITWMVQSMYLEKWISSDTSQTMYGIGSRTLAELDPNALVALVEHLYGEKMDKGAEADLRIRVYGSVPAQQ